MRTSIECHQDLFKNIKLINSNRNLKNESKESLKSFIIGSSSRINLNNPTINNCNFYMGDSSLNSPTSICNNQPLPDCFNIIVADDEVFTRLSTVRTLKAILRQMKISFNILEAEDGLETVYLIYKAAIQGAKISLIFSDENMNFMNGLRSSILAREIAEKKKLGEIPFFLVTAYDKSILDGHVTGNVDKILDKPLQKDAALQILQNVLKN
jgi:CheY-like chemotaxis protein